MIRLADCFFTVIDCLDVSRYLPQFYCVKMLFNNRLYITCLTDMEACFLNKRSGNECFNSEPICGV